MSYNDVAAMAQDEDLRLRIAGCISTQTGYIVPANTQDHPLSIADYFRWQMAGQPGWAEAYSYAVENEVENPGKDETVITDAMILSAVQAVLNIE